MHTAFYFAASILFCCVSSFACTCIGLSRPCEALKQDAAFVGRVIETVPVEHRVDKERWIVGYTMRLVVEESFRGDFGTEATIKTGRGNGDCGSPLPPGQRFIICASRQKDGTLWTGICNGNRQLTGDPAEKELLDEYRGLAKGDKGSIFGRVAMREVAWRNGRIDDEGSVFTRHVAIHAESEHFSETTVADDGGSYEFHAVPRGSYRIRPEVPLGWDVRHNDHEDFISVNVPPGACATASFSLNPTTRIRGHISFPPETRPRSVEVVAIPVNVKHVQRFIGKQVFTDANDRFDLWPLPPGDYFLGVNISNPGKPGSPFPPTYYPGVPTEAAAGIIHLDQGQIREIELPLPER